MTPKKGAIPKLSTEDKMFSLEIANEYAISPDIMELYFRQLLYSLKDHFQDNYLIHKIDHNKLISKRRHFYIKSHLQFVLWHIYDNWEIPKFRKCIIAALILIHLKLDKKICLI
jgi:hypothetical protein